MSPWLFQVYGKNDVVVITAVRKQVSRAWSPRVAKFQTYFDVVCVQNQCGGHKLLKYSAKIWKMSIIWWNKSKYVYKTLPYVWYYPFPLWINDLVRFHLTYQEKRSVFLPQKNPAAIHIFPNISKSKNNQTMKFDQLIEHNMRSIFLDKSYTK